MSNIYKTIKQLKKHAEDLPQSPYRDYLKFIDGSFLSKCLQTLADEHVDQLRYMILCTREKFHLEFNHETLQFFSIREKYSPKRPGEHLDEDHGPTKIPHINEPKDSQIKLYTSNQTKCSAVK
jgi:hypothetical protein